MQIRRQAGERLNLKDEGAMRDFYRSHPEVWDGAHSIELIDKHSLTPLVKVAQETHTLLMAWFR